MDSVFCALYALLFKMDLNRGKEDLRGAKAHRECKM